MGRTIVERTISAAPERVFEVVSEIEHFQQAIPHIIDVEFLTEKRRGVGTRFRETRLMGKREASSELEVTEYETPTRVRMVSDQGGIVWDTVFTVEPADEGTRLRMVMDATAYRLLAKLVNPLIAGTVRKAIEQDLDAVKAYCESGG